MRRRRQQFPEAVSTESATKANLKNLGSGTLEIINNTLKFHIEKGHFKKQKEIARDIPMTDIENVECVGNEFRITWKGVTDTFIIEDTELGEKMFEKITETLKEQTKMLEDKAAEKQKRNELTTLLSVAIKIVDSLFDVLRSLQGQIDWNRIESHLKNSEENIRSFAGQKTDTTRLDLTNLSLAVKEHLPEEVSKATYGILVSLHEYFSRLTSKNTYPDQTHPNYYDARTLVLAYYMLNDIILGTIVGDIEIGKEIDELLRMLDDLSKRAKLETNVDAIKDIINKFGMEKGKEAVIQESRAVFRQQLKELITT